MISGHLGGLLGHHRKHGRTSGVDARHITCWRWCGALDGEECWATDSIIGIPLPDMYAGETQNIRFLKIDDGKCEALRIAEFIHLLILNTLCKLKLFIFN